jgi:hypothetical protein
MPLPENKRKELASIIIRMQQANEPKANIQLVVDNFKQKFSTNNKPSFFQKAKDIGKDIGEKIDVGTQAFASGATFGALPFIEKKIGQAVFGKEKESQFQKEKKEKEERQKVAKTFGDILSFGTGGSSLVGKGIAKAGTKLAGKKLLKKAIQEGGIAATKEGTEKLFETGDIKQAGKRALTAGALGAGTTGALGGVAKGLGTLGKKIAKANPIALKSDNVKQVNETMKKFKINPDNLDNAFRKTKNIKKQTGKKISDLLTPMSKNPNKNVNFLETFNNIRKEIKDAGITESNLSKILKESKEIIKRKGPLNNINIKDANIIKSQLAERASFTGLETTKEKALKKAWKIVNKNLVKEIRNKANNKALNNALDDFGKLASVEKAAEKAFKAGEKTRPSRFTNILKGGVILGSGAVNPLLAVPAAAAFLPSTTQAVLLRSTGKGLQSIPGRTFGQLAGIGDR